MKTVNLGIDIGSTTVKIAALDEGKRLVWSSYTQAKGRPLQVLYEDIQRLLKEIPAKSISSIGITGSGGNLAAQLLGVSHCNELIAQSKAIELLYPQTRSVIELGGQDSKLLILESASGKVILEDFTMNSLCAAGTGSFLDQQASRLVLTIEEFADLSVHSETPARISGRCSVFAKSDMIHLQQIGIQKKDIVAGLCFAVARNFKSTLAKGKKLRTPVVFQGGVAANKGMVRAFREVFELNEQELLVPGEHKLMSAIGAAILSAQKPASSALSLEKLEKFLNKGAALPKSTLEPLSLQSGSCPGVLSRLQAARETPPATPHEQGQTRSNFNVYVGVDVGSVTTKAVILNEDLQVLRHIYQKTEGDPITAVKRVLKEVSKGIEDKVIVKGAGTTGSGRILIGNFIGADTVRNEITAQAVASLYIDKDVDTIFEIGGQDSKYISIENSVIRDFEMNKACAAGTGSFLEEQAIKLDVDVTKNFAELAFSCKSPCSLGERCTVFMESDLVSNQQLGAKKEELVAGLAYSIAYNYLNKVVADRKIGDRIFFQGGVAYNEAVVSAFEKILKKKIIVPRYHEVTGAIGAAILAKESSNGASNFIGFDLSNRKYNISIFECKGCPNHCEVSKVTLDNKDYYCGARCEKYDEKSTEKKEQTIDLFTSREKLIFGDGSESKHRPGTDSRLRPVPEVTNKGDRSSFGTGTVPKVGMPKVLHFYEFYPLWERFFRELGFDVISSDTTNPKIIREGTQSAVCETCFPVKIVHGHIIDLLDKGADFIFLPSMINYPPLYKDSKEGYFCPFAQAASFIVKAALEDQRLKDKKFLSPKIYLINDKIARRNIIEQLSKELGKSPAQIDAAFERAKEHMEQLRKRIKEEGAQILQNLNGEKRAFVVISRSYNGCDPGINVGIPKKLRDKGKIALPLDYLDLEGQEQFANMYWTSGQRIISAARKIKEDPRLYAIYVTNFSCGPDAFLLHYFKDIMGQKPYLQIEVDEHSGDAGVLTRIEAFLDSLK